MKTIILDGIETSKKIENDLLEKIKKLDNKPKLAIFKINNDKSSNIYINQKIKKCKELNIDVELYEFNEDSNERDIINKINECNNDISINGIIVELPIYNKFDQHKIVNTINIEKDVDGLTDINMINLINNNKCFIPCTVLGIEKLLKYYNIDVTNKKIAIINRSNLIGKPLFYRLINKDCTVTICHSKTENTDKICKDSDIIVTAVGKKDLINKNYINNNSIIIDAGIIKIDNKIYGDVNYNDVIDNCSYLTKVPGGVGPMTVISLMTNIYDAYINQNKL